MFVTDTHTIVWASTNKFSQLSPKVLSVFEKADKGETLIYIPSMVLLEVAILQHLGKINLKERFDYWADKILKKRGFEIVSLDVSILTTTFSTKLSSPLPSNSICR
jgi:PIN domain nuclease of toxin-antitoxin system